MTSWLLLAALLQQSPATDLIYVANQDAAKVTIIDASRHVAIDTIDLQTLGFSPTAKPHHIVVEPDGSHWYVSLIGENRVLKFDRTNNLVGQASFDQAGMLALHPTEDLLYATRSMTAVNPPQRIGVIERSTMSIDEIDVFFPRPHAIAVHQRGTHVYAGSLAENRIASLDLESQQLELTAVDGQPHSFVQFAVSPVAPVLVATTELTGQLLVFDIENPETPVLMKTIPVNPAPWDPVFTLDGRYVYFGNQLSNTITVVDAETWTIAKVIEGEGLSEPYGSVVTPDGRFIYVANRHIRSGEHAAHGMGDVGRTATVAVIEVATMSIVAVIAVPGDATGLGARRSQNR